MVNPGYSVLRAIWLFGVVGAVLAMPVATADTRVALIVGNSSYVAQELRLGNPVNDATAMQRALEAAGFKTIVRLNASRIDLYRAVEEFSKQIGRDPRAVGLFYYAGHGVQVDGTNYLIPVDAQVEAVSDLEANGFDIGRVLRAMEAAQNDMNIVILDACRNNPLPRTRGISRGLARMNAPTGTFIAYAAAPGQTAQDGAEGRNGVFTGELVKAIAEPGLALEQVFKRVIAGVKAETRGGQQPWTEASIQGDFYFHERAAGAAPAPAVDAGRIELAYWETVVDSRNPEDFRAYLRKYPRGEFSGLATNRLKVLAAANATQEGSSPERQSAPTAAEAPKPRRGDAAATGVVPQAAGAGGEAASERRCKALLDRAQTGDMLNDDERAFLSRNCH